MPRAEDAKHPVTIKTGPSEHREGKVAHIKTKRGEAAITASSDGSALVLSVHRVGGEVKLITPDGTTCDISTGGRMGSTKLTSSERVFRLFSELGTLRHEEFWVVGVDGQNGLMAKHQVARGGSGTVAVEAKQVLRAMVQEGAAAMIVVHNHPSGDPNPSREDGTTTVKLQEAASVIGMPLLDHIIIARSRYFSFRDAGLLT